MGEAKRELVGAASLGEASAVRLEEHRGDGGTLRIWRQPRQRVYSTRVVGHLSIDLARHIIEYVDPLFEGGRVIGFHDWFSMSGYDSPSRTQLTEWSLRRSKLAQINIGTRAKLVTMGVTVAALALGDHVLRRFGSEHELQAAYDQALLASSADRGGVRPP
ncbi:MAG TPA: hypothetical protein VMG12_08210 [Polyangiaceae bacterium]|nr:hypothetical protein [Polyangiaceae bacterium]